MKCYLLYTRNTSIPGLWTLRPSVACLSPSVHMSYPFMATWPTCCSLLLRVQWNIFLPNRVCYTQLRCPSCRK